MRFPNIRFAVMNVSTLGTSAATRVVSLFLGATVVFGGCVDPSRRALPVPFPLTYGGTPVPAHGVGLSLEFGDGLRGQELERTELLGGGILVGANDVFNVALNGYEETRNDGLSGTTLRIKIRAGSPFGPQSSLGIHVAAVWTNRTTSEQDESVYAVDVAVPVEFRMSPETGKRNYFSVYVGPRAVFENYTDRREPIESMKALYAGAVGGMHISIGVFHLFAEATAAYIPTNVYRGQTFGGRMTLVPATGAAIHFGRPYNWGLQR